MKNKIKQLLIKILNIFLHSETMNESRMKWKELGIKNPNYYVMTNFGEGITEEQFTESGREDYEEFIKKDKALNTLQHWNTKKVLEIGCGTGRITEFFCKDFKKVYGIDISESMISYGKHRLGEYDNVELMANDGLHYPLADNFVDIVFSFIVFQHMPSVKVVRKNIEEISRVLRLGGIAKIQLRGLPVSKDKWFYGPSFNRIGVEKLISETSFRILKFSGEGQKYFWVWLKKYK